MNRFRIILKNQDLFVSEQGIIDGQATYVDLPVFWQIGDVFFPCEDWDDMADPILYHWTENLLAHLWAERAEYKLYFMDGPYYLRVQQDGYNLTVTGVSFQTAFDQELCAFTCTYQELLQELLRAIKRLRYFLLTNPACKRGFDSAVCTTRHYEEEINKALIMLSQREI